MKKAPLAIRLMPKRFTSRFLGLLGRVPLPGFLLRPLLRLYTRTFGADLEEMARPLSTYRNFLDFFTRPLKEGLRPQSKDPRVIGSPADGRVYRAGAIENGTVLQAKGVPYSIADLLGSEVDAGRFEGGTYLVIYLAPGDYHRFHWHLDGRIKTIRHLPGELWPVNDKAVASVRGLFARNERIATLGQTASGAAFAYVPVGALNVGSIRLSFHDVRTRGWRRGKPRDWTIAHGGKRGDEFGWFEFGSSIVLLLAKEAGALAPIEPETKVRVGTEIGRLA